MELNWWSEERIFLFVQQEVNYCPNSCAWINKCLETRFQSELLFNARMASCVSGRDGGSVYQVERRSFSCHASQKCPCGGGWVGKWHRRKKDGQMNDRIVEGDSLSCVEL